MDGNFFPKNLKYLLNNNMITVKKILDLTNNTSPGLVTMWKNGERQITTKDLLKIANYLGYTIDDLINKDLSKINISKSDQIEMLFHKTKDILSDDDRATIEFLMKKAIDNYEKNKDKNVE